MRLPDISKPFVVRSEASDKGVGAVWLQYHDGVPFPVAFVSRGLKAAECNYSTIEKECLAIVVTVQRFSIYLMGKHFYLETDHKPLTYTVMPRYNGYIYRGFRYIEGS